MWNPFFLNLLAAGVFCFGLGACDFTIDEGSPTRTFSIGGRVAGSTGAVVLQNSNGTNLVVASEGTFTFETPMVSSAIYNVTVVVAPNFQTCLVAKGAGTVANAHISDVTVTCSPNTFTVSNTVAGDFP